MLVTTFPPACINSAGMLSTPADFLFFKDLTAASTSSRIIEKLSSSVFTGQSSTAAFPLVWLLYNSVQYSVHRLIIFLFSVRHVPDLSWMVFILPFFSRVRSFTTWNALLLVLVQVVFYFVALFFYSFFFLPLAIRSTQRNGRCPLYEEIHDWLYHLSLRYVS